MTCFLSSVNFAKVIYTGTNNNYEQPVGIALATQFTPTESFDWPATDRSIMEPGGDQVNVVSLEMMLIILKITVYNY